MSKSEEKGQVAAGAKPSGRAAVMESYRAANPQLTGEADDETLFDYAHNRGLDAENKYNELNGANARLADLIAKDPRLGALLSSVSGEKPQSMPYAIASIYGKDVLESDPEEVEAGYQEYLKQLSASRKEQEQALENIKEYKSNLEKYKDENQLSDEQLSQLNEAIFGDAENFLRGIIPAEYIDYKWKGLNYDADVRDAADTGFTEGKGTNVKADMKRKTESSLPDMNGGTGSGKRTGEAKIFQPRPDSVYNNLKEIRD